MIARTTTTCRHGNVDEYLARLLCNITFRLATFVISLKIAFSLCFRLSFNVTFAEEIETTFVYRYALEQKYMFPPGFEPGTFRV